MYADALFPCKRAAESTCYGSEKHRCFIIIIINCWLLKLQVSNRQHICQLLSIMLWQHLVPNSLASRYT